MIVVEGPDGAGKTHLVNRLSADLGLTPEARIVDKDTNAMGDLKTWVEKDLQSWPRTALYDRHRMISEPIYGPVLRDAPNPGFENIPWVGAKLMRFRRLEPTMIFCLPPLKDVMINVMTGADNLVVADKIVEIYWLYSMEAARWPNAYIWDYTTDTDEYYRGMLNSIRRREHIAGVGGGC